MTTSSTLSLKPKSEASLPRKRLNRSVSTAASVTASRTKKRNNKKINTLSQYWSRFNDKKNKRITPLSFNIHKEMEVDAIKNGYPISVKKIQDGLIAYTKRDVYVKALIKNRTRFNLLGEPSGYVNKQHRNNAIEALKLQQTITNRKKARQRPNVNVRYKRTRSLSACDSLAVKSE